MRRLQAAPGCLIVVGIVVLSSQGYAVDSTRQRALLLGVGIYAGDAFTWTLQSSSSASISAWVPLRPCPSVWTVW
jgi:hypothetical protein